MQRSRRAFVAGLATLGISASLAAVGTALPARAEEEAKPKAVTLTGTLVCLGCDFKKAHGAAAQCSVYGHKHALKTKKGRYYTFLENAKSEPLIKGETLHGKQVEVKGVVFPGSQVLEVQELKILGK
ncbi:MAG: hypothetical protein HY320_10155 [Armatimonadetes bacterium]|nr:hypothetical protein [Armatimonadota bacterium]